MKLLIFLAFCVIVAAVFSYPESGEGFGVMRGGFGGQQRFGSGSGERSFGRRGMGNFGSHEGFNQGGGGSGERSFDRRGLGNFGSHEGFQGMRGSREVGIMGSHENIQQGGGLGGRSGENLGSGEVIRQKRQWWGYRPWGFYGYRPWGYGFYG